MTPLNLQHLTYKQINVTTQEFLHSIYPTCSVPIPIEEIIEIDMGIRISLIPGLKRTFGIDGFINSDFKVITVDDYSYKF